MIIYILLLAAAVIAGIPLCSNKYQRWGKIVYCSALALTFILIAVLRYGVGYDYHLYGAKCYNISVNGIDFLMADKMEKGFLLPVYIFNLAVDKYYSIFIFAALAIYVPLFILIYKRSSIPWISVAAFLCFGLFFNSLCFLRQFVAAIIVAYAMKYTNAKDYPRFFVLVLSAGAFHWSALIMTVLFVFLKIKPNYIYLSIAAVGTILFCIFSRSLMFWFIDNFYMYRGYNPDVSVEAGTGLPMRYTIMFGVLFAVCFAFRKRLIEKNERNSVYINCLMFTTIFEAMGMRHAILSRFALLTYLPAILWLLPDLVIVVRECISEKINAPKKKSAVKTGAVVMSSIFAAGCYLVLMFNNYNGVVPYNTIFDHVDDVYSVQDWYPEDDDEDWDDEYLDDEDWDDEDWDDEDWDDEDWDDENWDDEDSDDEWEDDIDYEETE